MAVRFYVAHGASGSSASMRAHVEGLKRRGVDAIAIDLPVKTAEDVVPRFRTIVPDGPDAAGPAITVGGQSYGGRVATLAAAAEGTEYAGIVCFSYPLHRPGAPDDEVRTSHWPSIVCPALLLSGESDPFARIGLLRAAMPLLPHGTLVTYPKLGHTLRPVLEDVLDRVVAFVGGLLPQG